MARPAGFTGRACFSEGNYFISGVRWLFFSAGDHFHKAAIKRRTAADIGEPV
jgi:hypothetical protein